MGAQAAVESQLAHHHAALQSRGVYHVVAGQQPYGQREVVGRAFLFQVGRSQIDRDFLPRKVVAGVVEG